MSIDADEPVQEPEAHPYRRAARAEPTELAPYPCSSCGTILETKRIDASPEVSRLSRHSYLAGLAGTLAVLGGGWLAAKRGALDKGWGISSAPHDANRTMAFLLLVCSAVMFAVELAIRFDVDRGRMIKVAPELKNGETLRFVGRCFLIYGIELATISLFLGIYKYAGEYGYRGNAQGYYKPWFAVMETLRDIYLYGGLPYILFTRAIQHAPRSDRKQWAFTAMKGARLLFARLTRRRPEGLAPLDIYDRYAFLGLLVKAFYVPLMTVFFADQFPHLVKNFAWMSGPNFSLSTATVRDFYNVSHSFIFAVDVGLAWCGYVVSSRWIKNTMFSVEPTFLGWFVAISCYPPHNRNIGVYFGTPGEDAFFAIPDQRVVAFFAILSVLSFTVYTAATVVFGLRFSNLTHRGIITTGPYAFIRHPAYASKNFSWWCVMLPFVVWQMWSNKTWEPLAQIVGMLFMSFFYYWRAITEERHLSRDPEYRKYMKKVPYRFIPGVL